MASQKDFGEMFGVKFDMRQKQISELAMKRAILQILSSSELDADALNAMMADARASGDDKYKNVKDLNILEDGRMHSPDAYGTRSDLSGGDAKQQVRKDEKTHENPTSKMESFNETDNKFELRGRHTFSSVLVHLPFLLTGHSADEINPVNVLSVLLQICTENGLELLQRRDDNGMVLEQDTGDFTIVPMQQKEKGNNRDN